MKKRRSKSYIICLRGLLELHKLSTVGLLQTEDQAEPIRLQLDKVWRDITQKEAEELSQLSVDLNEVQRL